MGQPCETNLRTRSEGHMHSLISVILAAGCHRALQSANLRKDIPSTTSDPSKTVFNFFRFAGLHSLQRVWPFITIQGYAAT